MRVRLLVAVFLGTVGGVALHALRAQQAPRRAVVKLSVQMAAPDGCYVREIAQKQDSLFYEVGCKGAAFRIDTTAVTP